MLNIKNYSLAKNIHIYKQGELYIAYDVNSGSLHLLDNKTYRLLGELIEYQKVSAEPIVSLDDFGQYLAPTDKEEILAELDQLQQHNLLFSPEAKENAPKYPAPPLIKALCLHVAHDCNLKCRYCFAGTGLFGGSRELMSIETGKKALDFLLKYSGHRKQCEVDFFGGEPLLNMEVVKALISYGQTAATRVGKTMKFTLTTNAVLLDEETAAFLEEAQVSLVLSLDGRQEVNDNMRPFSNNQGSYNRIVPNILRAIQTRHDPSPYAIGNYYYVRGTYTHYNTDFYLMVYTQKYVYIYSHRGWE